MKTLAVTLLIVIVAFAVIKIHLMIKAFLLELLEDWKAK